MIPNWNSLSKSKDKDKSNTRRVRTAEYHTESCMKAGAAAVYARL